MRGSEWIKIGVETGAGKTACPQSIMYGTTIPGDSDLTFRAATGELVKGGKRMHVVGCDDWGPNLRVRGVQAPVCKPCSKELGWASHGRPTQELAGNVARTAGRRYFLAQSFSLRSRSFASRCGTQWHNGALRGVRGRTLLWLRRNVLVLFSLYSVVPFLFLLVMCIFPDPPAHDTVGVNLKGRLRLTWLHHRPHEVLLLPPGRDFALRSKLCVHRAHRTRFLSFLRSPRMWFSKGAHDEVVSTIVYMKCSGFLRAASLRFGTQCCMEIAPISRI